MKNLLFNLTYKLFGLRKKPMTQARAKQILDGLPPTERIKRLEGVKSKFGSDGRRLFV